MGDFLSFRRFFTPTLIQVVFWIGVGVCVVEGITMIASSAGAFARGIGIVNGLLVLFVGPVVVRVLCEVLMAIFRIHDSLAGGSEQ